MSMVVLICRCGPTSQDPNSKEKLQSCLQCTLKTKATLCTKAIMISERQLSTTVFILLDFSMRHHVIAEVLISSPIHCHTHN